MSVRFIKCIIFLCLFLCLTFALVFLCLALKWSWFCSILPDFASLKKCKIKQLFHILQWRTGKNVYFAKGLAAKSKDYWFSITANISFPGSTLQYSEVLMKFIWLLPQPLTLLWYLRLFYEFLVLFLLALTVIISCPWVKIYIGYFIHCCLKWSLKCDCFCIVWSVFWLYESIWDLNIIF